MPLRASLLAIGLATLVGCLVPTVDLSGKKCDSSGKCATGFTCATGVCVVPACSPGAVQSCSSAVACAGPTQVCGPDSRWGACEAQGDGGPPPCAKQLGVCAGAVAACGTNGQWSACTDGTYLANNPAYSPTEVCDGLDNDCNGMVDDNLAPHACALTQGVCAGSTAACGGDAGWLACTAASYGPDYSPTEICDGLDNDCNGQVDDHLPPHPCSNQVGVCAGSDATCGGDAGWLACTAANYLANNPNYSATAICSDLDVMCNGHIDQGFACVKDANDGGACTTTCHSTGVATCDSTCSSYACAPPSEICNGVDNDCDGTIGNGLTQASAQQISNDPATSQSSSVAVGLDGGLVVYADNTSSVFQVHVQPVSAGLAPQGASWVAATTSHDQTAPRVLSVPGGYALTWLESNQVWVASLGPGGRLVGAPTALGGSAALAVSYGVAAATPGSSATIYVVWEDARGVPTVPEQLYFESVAGSTPLGVEMVSPSAGPLHHPSLATSSDGGYLGLAYEDAVLGSSQIGLTVVTASTGALVAGSTSTLTPTSIGFYPSVAATNAGFAVAWQSVSPAAIAVSVNGSPGTIVDPIPDGGGSNAQGAFLAAGPSGMLLTWQDDRASSPTPLIWMARLAPSGAIANDTAGPALLHLPLASGAAQFAPSAVFTGATYAVTWENATANDDIYAQEVCP